MTGQEQKAVAQLHPVKYAARVWGVSERTAWGAVAANKVRVTRLGRCVRVSDEEIERVAREGF